MRRAIAAAFFLCLFVYQAQAEPHYITQARQHLGKTGPQLGLPATLWCADFINMVLERAGLRGTKSRAAASFMGLRKIQGPQPGAIAVIGGNGYIRHVGFVTGVEPDGDPIILSGNSYQRKVYEGAYPRSQVLAYVIPD